MKNVKRLLFFLVAMILALLVRPTSVRAATSDTSDASYANNLVRDYGIPDDVIQVLLDYSKNADGKSPAEDGATPATFTVGDVEKLTTVSLAKPYVQADGVTVSTADATVADWIKSAVDVSNTGDSTVVDAYNINPNVYAQNVAGTVDAADGPLATKVLTVNGSHQHPAVNFLFQILACAKSATRLDLTGVTSEISDSTTAQMILGLFQTDRLPNLSSLILGRDNLTNLDQIWELQSTVFKTTLAQNIKELDLSNNGMTSFPWGATMPIGTHLVKLNLSGNDTSLITDTLNTLLQDVVQNDGEGDLSDANLEVSNWNTLHYIVQLIDADTGSLRLNDYSVNAIVLAAPGDLNDRAVTRYMPQMTVAAAQALLDKNTQLSSSVRQALEDYIKNGGKMVASTDSLSVAGAIAFGQIALSDLAGEHTAKIDLQLTATLNPNRAIYVAMDSWHTSDKTSSFASNLTFQTADGSSMITRTSSPQLFYANTGDAVTTYQQTLTQVTMTIPPDQQTLVRAQAYTATLDWTVSNAPSGTAR